MEMSATVGRRADTRANTPRFTSTCSEMVEHDESAGVEDLPQKHENV